MDQYGCWSHSVSISTGEKENKAEEGRSHVICWGHLSGIYNLISARIPLGRLSFSHTLLKRRLRNAAFISGGLTPAAHWVSFSIAGRIDPGNKLAIPAAGVISGGVIQCHMVKSADSGACLCSALPLTIYVILGKFTFSVPQFPPLENGGSSARRED